MLYKKHDSSLDTIQMKIFGLLFKADNNGNKKGKKKKALRQKVTEVISYEHNILMFQGYF